MAPKPEITVSPEKPMPNGYAFLPKGIQYKTLHCRRLTHEAGRQLYVVKDPKSKRIMGIRVPKSIFFQVQNLARETLPSRRAAVEQRDATLLRQAAAELKDRFPNMPAPEQEKVLKHAFRKHSRRVGRTAQIPMSKKVDRAVIAHIRHKHTKYDRYMDQGVDKEEARKRIVGSIRDKLKEWGFDGELPWYLDDSDSESDELSDEV